MSRLETYDWPGNVRELENTIERAVALESGTEISTTVLPDRISGASIASVSLPGDSRGLSFPAEGMDFEGVIAETEKRYLQAALEKADGVRTRAAELLKISYRSFRHLAKKHEPIEAEIEQGNVLERGLIAFASVEVFEDNCKQIFLRWRGILCEP